MCDSRDIVVCLGMGHPGPACSIPAALVHWGGEAGLAPRAGPSAFTAISAPKGTPSKCIGSLGGL